MPVLDETHAPGLLSWVASAEGHADFPIQNLPLGVFSTGGGSRRGGVAIGDDIVDLAELSASGLLQGEALAACEAAAQILTHHASNGCNLNPGDLLGTGTLSSPTPGGFGSLLELTEGGKTPIELPSGEQRRFFEDGDELIIEAHARRDGYASIGFGGCRAAVLPATPGSTGG